VSEKLRQIVISKEDAVFRMDKNGVWCNEHGKFEHPRIIKYFNSAIKKDENGYYVHQVSDVSEEKVYFSHEDTALFVVDVKIQEEACLILNTGATLGFDQGQLFAKDDNLYLHTPEHRVKFSANALVKISRFMEEKDDQLSVIINGKIYSVQ